MLVAVEWSRVKRMDDDRGIIKNDMDDVKTTMTMTTTATTAATVTMMDDERGDAFTGTWTTWTDIGTTPERTADTMSHHWHLYSRSSRSSRVVRMKIQGPSWIY